MTTPYIDPQAVHNPSTGASPPAAWGDTVRDGLEFLVRPPGCIVVRTAALSVPHNTWTTVPFTAADRRDTDAYHSTSTTPERMIVPAGLGGWYDVGASATFASSSTSNRQIRVVVNGSIQPIPTEVWLGQSSSSGTMTGVPILLTAGDYVEVNVFQFSGGALNLANAEAWLWFKGL